MIKKRQTGTFASGRLPTGFETFESGMIACEKTLSKHSDSSKLAFVGGDLRGGVVDAILTCKAEQFCDVDAFAATDAFLACSSPPTLENSAKVVDQELCNCLKKARDPSWNSKE